MYSRRLLEGAAVFAEPETRSPGVAEMPKEVAFAWLDLDSRPRLILNSELRLVWLNGAAAAALAEYPGMAIDDQQVKKGDLREQLKKFLRDRASAIWEKPVKFDPGEGYYIVRAVRVRSSEEYICVEIRIAHPKAKISYVDLRHPFGFTAAEEQIALFLLDGLSVSEIANERETSVETVRSHVRSIYEKMNISSREELFSKLRYFQFF